MMKNNSIKGYVILGILFILASVIVFSVPTVKTATFWIAYAFTAAAFAAQVVIWKVAFEKEKILKSTFLGLPVVHIGIVYAVVQTIELGIFIFMPLLPVWSAIVVCTAIAGISVICMISVEAGCNEIERVEAKVQKRVFYIRELQTDVELLAVNEPDKEIKEALSQLADKIRFSDPMSNEQLADLENKISVGVAELKTASNKPEIITELNSLLDERNKKCKILK